MKLWDLFDELLALPEDADPQEAALRLAGGDEQLAARALDLMKAHVKVETLKQVTMQPATKPPTRQFGAYRSIRLLGSGGMGAVYLAERTDGQFEQQVAVKVLNPFAAGPLFEERLRVERQILANLSHPNIARLLDGNVSADGDPFLVLEYVDGVSLDQYCDRKQLTLEGRLELFLKICEAVDFAHRHMVIHRDLKPSNILVTEEGEPKLLDFGTARLMQTEGPAPTTTAMMTPRYASPEQLRSQPMNTATDVYSLGVVLFELLTGAWPFGDITNPELALVRAVKEIPPRPPAEVVSEKAAAARSGTVESLTAALRGDLTSILMKALEEDPARRYASVRELAADLERYRDGLPVLARQQTVSYRAAKFVRRNRLRVGAAALLVVTLLGGIAATLWQAREAHLSRATAERRFEDIRKLANYLLFDVPTGLQRLPGSTLLQRQVVERSLQYLDGLAQESPRDVSLRLEMAQAYERLADVLGNPYRPSLGDRKRALETYEKALAITRGLVAESPRDAAVRRVDSSVHVQHGATLFFGGKNAEGLEEVRKAVEQLRALIKDRPGDWETRLALAVAIEFQATQERSGGGLVIGPATAKVQTLYDEALEHLATVLDKRPDDTRVVKQLAQTEFGASILWGSLDPARSIEHLKKALGWLDRLPKEVQDGVDIRRQRAGILMNIGWAQGQLRQNRDGVASINEAQKVLEVLSAMDPANTSARYQLTAVYRSRGIIRGYDGDAAAAAEDFLHAAEMHRRLSEENPAVSVYRFLRGELLVRAANHMVTLKRLDEARARGGEGLEILKQLAGVPKASLAHVLGACRWLNEIAVPGLKDPLGAARYCQMAVDQTEGKDADAWEGLATSRDQLKDRAGAAEAAQRALALIPPQDPGQPKSRQREILEGLAAGAGKK